MTGAAAVVFVHAGYHSSAEKGHTDNLPTIYPIKFNACTFYLSYCLNRLYFASNDNNRINDEKEKQVDR